MAGKQTIRKLCATLLTSVLLGLSGSAAAQQTTAQIANYSPDELDTLVGPIALYPDDVLGILLPAATYPLQIVEAQRFLDTNPQEGAEPDANWDSTVIALLNYPEAVQLLSDDLEWTATLGDAVLAQETDVLEAIERFRDAAWLAGNLESNERQTVVRSAESIEILPVEPDVVYLPYYDPVTVVVQQPAPVVGWYDWGYPLYYHAYPGPFVFNRPFFRVPLFFEISWRNRYLNLFGFDYGIWWNRRAGFYGHAPLNAVRYNRFQRHFGARGIGFQAQRWRHSPRVGVRSARYHRYGNRDRGARANQGYTVRPNRQAIPQNRFDARPNTRNNVASYRGTDRSASVARRSPNAAGTPNANTRSTNARGTNARSTASRAGSNSRFTTRGSVRRTPEPTGGAVAGGRSYSTNPRSAAPTPSASGRSASGYTRGGAAPQSRLTQQRVLEPRGQAYGGTVQPRTRSVTPSTRSVAPTSRGTVSRAAPRTSSRAAPRSSSRAAPRATSRPAPRASSSRSSRARSSARSGGSRSSGSRGSGRSRSSGRRGGN
ncbi:MAG: DUF3300 domain-containing protein [Pseudomonadota bacterium]